MKKFFLKYSLSIVTIIDLLRILFNTSGVDYNINYCIEPLTIAALIAAGVSVGSKVASELTKKNPYTKYGYKNGIYDPSYGHIQGYQIKPQEKRAYTYTPNNDWSKGLNTTSQVAGVASAALGGAAALGVGAAGTAATTGTTVASNSSNLGLSTMDSLGVGWNAANTGTQAGFGANALANASSLTNVTTPAVTSSFGAGTLAGLTNASNTALTAVGTKIPSSPSFMEQLNTFKKGYEGISKPLNTVTKGISGLYGDNKKVELEQSKSLVDANATEEETNNLLTPTTPSMVSGTDFTWGVGTKQPGPINQNYVTPSFSGIGAGVLPNTISRGIGNNTNIDMNNINAMIQQYLNKAKPKTSSY